MLLPQQPAILVYFEIDNCNFPNVCVIKIGDCFSGVIFWDLNICQIV